MVIKWTDIAEHIPEEGRHLVYFFEGTGGPCCGFYFGRDEEYPCDNDHVFGCGTGFLTGDVTHWMYLPEYPEGNEHLIERRDEWLESVKQDIEDIKKPIGIFSQMKERMDRIDRNSSN